MENGAAFSRGGVVVRRALTPTLSQGERGLAEQEFSSLSAGKIASRAVAWKNGAAFSTGDGVARGAPSPQPSPRGERGLSEQAISSLSAGKIASRAVAWKNGAAFSTGDGVARRALTPTLFQRVRGLSGQAISPVSSINSISHGQIAISRHILVR
ncbi:hypothetical protein AR540_10530 [Pseudomonas sp. EpS/L25]|nr:hypothetical protein AR540_10530 [Pseudomonas sp. EpS/L25]